MADRPITPKLSIITGNIADIDADVLAVSCIQGGPLSGAAQEVDKAIGGLLKELLDSGSFKGRAVETEWVYPAPLKTRRVLLVGAGKADQYDLRIVRRLAAVAVRQARARKASRVCLALDAPAGMPSERFVQEVADGVVTGLVRL